MEKSKQFNMYSSNFLVLGFCLATLLLFFLFFIKPTAREIKKIDVDINYYNTEIKDQERFRQMYLKLDESVKKYNELFVPTTVKAKLPKSQIEMIPELFRAIVSKSNMKTVSIIPDVKSLSAGSGPLLVSCTVEGGYSHFKNLVQLLDTLSYVDVIEEVEMVGIRSKIRYSLEVWVEIGD